MDFYQIKERSPSKGVIEIYPDFKVCRSDDLMVRGKAFYAIWDAERGMWSTDEYDVQRLVDEDLWNRYKVVSEHAGMNSVVVKLMSDFSSNSWYQFRKYMSSISDSYHQLDEHITFANTVISKKDYISKRVNYNLEAGDYSSYEELISTLYEPEERAKIEWAIGSIVAGDSKTIQKFLVLYGEAGAGKSTILNIIQKLFEGYYTTFEAKALTSVSNQFATEVFKSNPLVAIQHDGDLSKIEDNTKLNSIVSHEEMTMNEKYKASYMSRANCFLFMATNRPVKITDAKSGVIRRLIDVSPSGRRIPAKRYQALMSQIEFELGAIAQHCLEVYREMGKNYYNNYRPLNMILQTDVFFNFVEANYDIFKEQDSTTLTQAYDIYKNYCDDSMVEFKMPRHRFREELKSYFREFSDMARVDGKVTRNCYTGFIFSKFNRNESDAAEPPPAIVLDSETSILDDILADCKAQYATETEKPIKKWSEVETTLKDIDTHKLHYVRPPANHIVLDFDLKDENGNKSFEKNVEEACKWPRTYTEISKGGHGLHLHYIYEGDPKELAVLVSTGIEIKQFSGLSSLRRKLTKCLNIPLYILKEGSLPKREKKVINFDAVKNEKQIRDMVNKNLRKEYHPSTKCSIDFISKILEDAYSSGVKYDITDLRPRVLAFANNSTNQSLYCIKAVSKMKFKSDEPSASSLFPDESELIFFDVEVFPNLFLVNWKRKGKDQKCVRMINPTPKDIEELLKFKLVGFNNRRYDNHILYARYIGYTNEQLFELSKRIIEGSRNAMFGEAYNISYTDVYDFSSKKQSLKKFEVELGIHHQELDLPWDQPVAEEMWTKVAEYCDNDVIATEAVFDDRKADFDARLILSEISGLTPNDTTQQQAAKIIFGNDKNPQEKFNYVDLSIEFPGYKFENGKSWYKGVEPGEGGRVFARPGMYTNVALLDIASMHPSTIEALNLFGPYTKKFSEIKAARIAIKHKDYDAVSGMFNGILKKYLGNKEEEEKLAYSLKIVINIVYGLTAASFPNKFRDPRNIDNIVAKRGALFMIDLQEYVESKGYDVIHIKTDSIKIPNATDEIIQDVMEFGKKYGYVFEHEATYDKLCLVNDAVYIAHASKGKHAGEWTATGKQFQIPYVFKSLFSKEPLSFDDFCITQAANTNLYLAMGEEDDLSKYQFIGKVGKFCPVKKGGGILKRIEKDGRYSNATGTTGYRFMESEMIKTLDNYEELIDKSYFEELANEAVKDISKYGDWEWFSSEKSEEVPWYTGLEICQNCDGKNSTCVNCEKESKQYA